MTSSNGNISALLAICAGKSPVPGEFPAQRPVTRSFHVFFDLRLNKPLSKQSRGWLFETISRPLWRHCNARKLYQILAGVPKLKIIILSVYWTQCKFSLEICLIVYMWWIVHFIDHSRTVDSYCGRKYNLPYSHVVFSVKLIKMTCSYYAIFRSSLFQSWDFAYTSLSKSTPWHPWRILVWYFMKWVYFPEVHLYQSGGCKADCVHWPEVI